MTQQISPIVLYVALDPEALEALNTYLRIHPAPGETEALIRAAKAVRSSYSGTQSLVAMSKRLGVGKETGR